MIQNIVNPWLNYWEGKQRLKGAEAGGEIAKQGYDQLLQQGEEQFGKQRSTWNPWVAYGETGRGYLQDILNEIASGTGVPEWQAERDVNPYLSPAVDFRRQQGVMARDQSAASKGGIFDTGYQNQLEAFGQGLASEEYGKAFERMNSMNTLGLNKYQSLLNNVTQGRQMRMNGIQDMVAKGMLGTQGISNAVKDYYTTMGQSTLGKSQVDSQLAALRKQQEGAFGRTLLSSLAGLGDAGIQAYVGIPEFNSWVNKGLGIGQNPYQDVLDDYGSYTMQRGMSDIPMYDTDPASFYFNDVSPEQMGSSSFNDVSPEQMGSSFSDVPSGFTSKYQFGGNFGQQNYTPVSPWGQMTPASGNDIYPPYVQPQKQQPFDQSFGMGSFSFQ